MHICPELNLTSEDKSLLQLRDADVEGLLQSSNCGNEIDRDKLYRWAYLTASNYYCMKVKFEADLTSIDAEELSSDFFLEFERTLPRMKSATRFTRYVLKQNLKRFLKRKKALRYRETGVREEEIHSQKVLSYREEILRPWEDWTDEDFLQYKTVLETFQKTDETTQKIIKYRLEDPPLPYKDISDQLKISETAIRMRVMRFYSAVRQKYDKKFRNSVTSLHYLTLYLVEWLLI
jgi:DNA-directed RNA polymerase specialized sigma24 family protein